MNSDITFAMMVKAMANKTDIHAKKYRREKQMQLATQNT
jgi:hypothetical protein